MGLQKVAFNFMVERGGKLAKSLLCTKPQKAVTSIQGLKYKPLYCNVTDFSNITIAKIKNLHKGDFYKAMTDKGWMPEMPIFNMPENKLLKAMKNNDYETIQKHFDFEVLANDGFMSYLKQKGYSKGAWTIDKNILNKLWSEFVNYENEFYKIFDKYLFPVSKNKKCFEVEQKLSSMGISVRLTEHENMADDIYNACLKMKNAGIKNIPNIRVEPKNTTNCCMGLPNKNTKDGYVFIGGMRENANSIIVSDTLEGLVYHETAHCLNNHLQCINSMSCFTEQDQYFQGVKEILKKYVSIYSANNPNEAASEIFCGMMLGKKYPKEVINILDFYKAVNPNSLR